MSASNLFPALPSGGATSYKRVGIASADISGPYHCGGVGAAYHGLALELAAVGHQVTILYLHPRFHQGTPAEWTGYFRERGIEFVHLPQEAHGAVWYGNRKEASLRCFEWLARQEPFDVIHFPEWLGLPYYSLLAKRQGLAFSQTTLCVGTHGSQRWNREGDQTLPTRAEDLVVDFLERLSVAMADVVVSPSRHLLEWMRDDGWQLPAASFISQNVLEPLALGMREAGDTAVRELVFFGRLDHRKGLPFFCDVLDRLAGTDGFTVTFLGSDVMVDGRRSSDYIRRRAQAWRGEPRLLTGYSRNQALEYLSQPGRLAVIPSLADNSPCTVQECLQEGIPFLASDRGGIPELVHHDDWERAIAPVNVEVFAGRLREILRSGQAPARPAVDFGETRAAWRAWHGGLPKAEPRTGAGPDWGAEPPLVSVCIAHYQRPRLLEQMVESLRVQTYPRLEVVLVDDGSTRAETLAYLDSLRAEFAGRGWQLLVQENAGPGAARDRAARAATGAYLLFADDDDVLLPHAIETLARIAVRTEADALSCVLMEFEGDRIPEHPEQARRLLIPLGPALAAALTNSELGGTAFLVKRECYFAVGGFPQDRDADEDWEFLLRVAAAGFDLQAVPLPLVWYRVHAGTRSRADNRFARVRSRLRTFERMLPMELRDLAALAYSRLTSVTDAGSQRRLERVFATLEKRRRATSVPPAPGEPPEQR